jgi:hypothetical protein
MRKLTKALEQQGASVGPVTTQQITYREVARRLRELAALLDGLEGAE